MSFAITGDDIRKYSESVNKPNGFKLNIFELGTQLMRSIDGNGDSAWLELTNVGLTDSLISGRFYTLDKKLISAGSDFYAVTKGEFRNVKIIR